MKAFENLPYKNNKNEAIDFERKRFQFWLENVPENIRRMEFDLFKLYRKILHANLHKNDNKQSHGRFVIYPEFDSVAEYESWENFSRSFLRGKERIDRLNAIVASIKINLDDLLEKAGLSVKKEKIKLVALGGSGMYGPRREGERLSDIDVHVLLDESGKSASSESFVKIGDGADTQYHIVCAGYGDDSRGANHQIHWLLYPHFPIVNKLGDEGIKNIINGIVEDTNKREIDIKNYIGQLNSRFDRLRESEVGEDHQI